VPVTRTVAQDQAAAVAASQVWPRLLDGTPDPGGKVVLLGVGMSNTSNVFNAMLYEINHSGVTPSTLHAIDTTMGGQGAPQWADPNCECWTNLDAKLIKKKRSAYQVGAVFVMLTTPFPWQTPEANATRFAAEYASILLQLEARFPNLRVVISAANYFGGYNTTGKTPEPHDYWENRELQGIQDGHTGSAFVGGLTIWTNGVDLRPWPSPAPPRPWSGLNLLCEDTNNGVHVSPLGKPKFGAWVYDTLMLDPATLGWLR
jgi:hypothetical protein